jgi:hypothetical protein
MRSAARLLRLALIAGLASVLVLPGGTEARAAGPGWEFRFVDRATDADSYAGTQTFVHVTPAGRSLVLYYDGPLGNGRFDMKVARGPLPDGSFEIESVDPDDTELLGYGSLAVDSRERAHVSYISGLFFGQGILKYARRRATGWQIEVADSTPGVTATAVAVDSADRPLIAYGTLSNGLRLATRKGSSWSNELVSFESVQALDMALDGAGHPRIAYIAWDGSAYVLRLATFDGATWTFETVSHVSSVGIDFGVGLALDSRGEESIAFPVYEPKQGMAFAQHLPSGGWDVQLIRQGDLRYPGLAVDDTGNAHVTFYEATIGALVYGRRVVAGGWRFQIVDDDPSPSIRIGRQSSIAVDADGRARVSYYVGDAFRGAALKLAISS